MDTIQESLRPAHAGLFARRGRQYLPRPDPAQRVWLARRTLDGWRAADRLLRRAESGPARDAYERAVDIALARLARFSSIDQLVDHWTNDRHRRLSDVGAPPADTVEAWVAEACQVAPDRPPLEDDLVSRAALWRRAEQILRIARP